jgi:hypothetical protein
MEGYPCKDRVNDSYVRARRRRAPSASSDSKSVHRRLAHSRGKLCMFLGGDFLDRCGDGRFIVVGLKLEKVSYGASWFELCRKELFRISCKDKPQWWCGLQRRPSDGLRYYFRQSLAIIPPKKRHMEPSLGVSGTV